MASWQRVESGDAGRLVYIDKGLPLAGLLLSLLGLAGTIGTGGQVALCFLNVPHGPFSTGSHVLGTLLCMVLLAVGLKMLVRREVVLDKVASEVIQTRCWLVWRRPVTTSLEGFTSVAWRHKLRDPNTDMSTSIYPVYLTGREPELALSEPLQMEEARRLTDEVTAFLGLEAEHLDRALLAGSADTVTALHRVMRRVFTPRTKLWSPSADPNQLICRRMLLVLGCRGFTIHKNLDMVKTWWGFLAPLLSKQHDLGPFRCVALSRQVTRTSTGCPAILHRVALQGQHGDQLTIYESWSGEEAKSLGEEVATFLKWELIVGPERQTP